MIPETTKEKLVETIEQFDHSLRDTPDWSDWERNENHKYAISFNNRLYPVKKIISLATGATRSSFSGGEESNRYLIKKGFSVVKLRDDNSNAYSGEDVLGKSEPDMEIKSLIKSVANTGFSFEPWQIAAYVAALRTKPFVILAGVSGTGKSKLPSLVAKLTGADARLLPVRPDWTDSSEVLGYIDLQGAFRPGTLLQFAKEASENRNKQFVCIMDEMNIARVEHYFAEILSRLEDRRVSDMGGYESGPLVSQRLPESDKVWSDQGLPANFSIVGTVNMDESTYGFSRKVLDRAFTIELSDIDLSSWNSVNHEELVLKQWPVQAWYPIAIQLGELVIKNEERDIITQIISSLSEINRFLIHAQLQVGYRTRDEIILFVLHSREMISSFITRQGEKVSPLDLALQMKILPRIAGGSGAIRRTLLELLGWAYNGKAFQEEDQADEIIKIWESTGRYGSLKAAQFPRTASRLCLMWERLRNEGFTSFWL